MELMHTGLIDSNPDGLLVHQWHDWQYTSDLSTDRVKRFRKRHETVSCNAPEQNRTEQIQNRAESPLPPLTEGTDAWAESVYARWKKRGDKVLAMQALSQVSMVRDSFEKQYAFWFAYYEAIGWQFAPKLANFLHDQSYLYDPPALTPKAETTEEMLARHDRENGET